MSNKSKRFAVLVIMAVCTLWVMVAIVSMLAGLYANNMIQAGLSLAVMVVNTLAVLVADKVYCAFGGE